MVPKYIKQNLWRLDIHHQVMLPNSSQLGAKTDSSVFSPWISEDAKCDNSGGLVFTYERALFKFQTAFRKEIPLSSLLPLLISSPPFH